MYNKESLTEMAIWKNLMNHGEILKNTNLSRMFEENPNRAEILSVSTKHIYYDYSRQLVTPETISLLIKLANERGLKEKIRQMFQGEKINVTENRAALHTALRSPIHLPICVDGVDVTPDVHKVLKKIENFSNEILSGKRKSVTGDKFKNIVSIGIGGSYLGVDYLATALRPYAKEDMNLVFVSNVDRTDFHEKTKGLRPEETLVIVISKTFSTAETMMNANTAKEWMLEKMFYMPGEAIVRNHFVAISTEEDRVKKFGIDPDNMFVFWDWVGGRYSATSAVGALPLSLYLGFDNFGKILQGANFMDEHFRTEEFHKNIPVLSGLIDIWNINFWGMKTRALLPYSQALSKLPAHTQQVEMESNGKYINIYEDAVNYDTGEVVFGEAGTNGQHSFYQLIHQGTQVIPCDFIGFIKPQYPEKLSSQQVVTHHEELMTNFFAQPDALAFGKSDILPYKRFTGNRPSSSLLLEELNPFTAGILLAWTEHRAVVKGFIWEVNSFDQFGVELGKELGRKFREEIRKKRENKDYEVDGGNPSTNIMLNAFLNGKLPNKV